MHGPGEILHIVAVAGHAAGEAGQAEGVKLAAAEVHGLLEKVLPHIIGNVVGVVDGLGVGIDVNPEGGQGAQNHQRAPEKNLPHGLPGHDFVDQVLQNIGQQQLADGGYQLHGNDTGNGPCIGLHVAKSEFHSVSFPGLRSQDQPWAHLLLMTDFP